MTPHFDLVVLGAGSGNMVLDRRFAGWSVAIVEPGRFGGTCLNVGCIPTKMYVHPADVARATRSAAPLGVRAEVDGVDWAAVRDRVFARIDPLGPAEHDRRAGLPGTTVYDAAARFVGDRVLELTPNDGGAPERITATHVVVAVGSRVVLPPLPGLADVPHHTSDTVMRLPHLPRRVVIVGGGFVAAEFAHVFSSYGAEVVQVHRGPQLLGKEDEDVAATFTARAGRQWDLRLSTSVVSAEPWREGAALTLGDGSVLETDCLLLATGRTSNADLLGLEAGGIAADQASVIRVDAQQRTSAPGVWALGDAANHHQLKHVANREARTVRHNLLNPGSMVATDDRFVPSAVFTSPQVASVGLTEQAARAAGTPYVSAMHGYADVAYGWAMGAEGPGDGGPFVKLLADPDSGLLLGAHVIGPEASLLLQPLLQAMVFGQPAHEVARAPYWIHPALSEVVENALLDLGRASRR
ncbi:MAG: mycothione reductase [Marmoricola sp.]